jgi:DNA invertase Pin-like site-specific DNA recombinase
MNPPELKCATYTRKSSEEGLDQSFNSLDAQRESCEAFIQSQRQEGWRILPTKYDDGGFSGGTMERPALKRLLEDVANRKINTIVVYKVDRLTRSLADFAKIVEILDKNGVSFVSVTQQFNTTTSMGRLTLNVLLSFAQFEREVTGERIRDKIAASKRKGMWMGGLVPLGYALKDRKLVPDKKEADLVSRIFDLYTRLGCVSKLATELLREKVKSKVWVTNTGARLGGKPFSRGALYHLLRNHLYIGEIRHRDKCYPGEHEGIVKPDLWAKVQAQLTGNLRTHRHRLQERSSSLFTGMLEDQSGVRYTPSFTNKGGRRYRYYVFQSTTSNARTSRIRRLPAREIEGVVCHRLRAFLASETEVYDVFHETADRPALLRPLLSSAQHLAAAWDRFGTREIRTVIRSCIQKIIVDESNVRVLVSRPGLRLYLQKPESPIPDLPPIEPTDFFTLKVDAKRKRCGGEVHLVVSSPQVSTAYPKSALVKALVRAHVWHQKVLDGKALDQRALAREAGFTERYVGRVFACAFLAPDIVEAILDGRQPRDLTFEKLTRNIPLSWVEQRCQFGFPPRP